jgi:lipoprotein-releasing system permease protein
VRAKGRSGFRTLITGFAVGGVAVGVAAAIIVLGVMNGFSKEVRSRIVGTNSHVVLVDVEREGIENIEAVREEVERVEGVVATSPFVSDKVMLSSDWESEGAILRGIDLAKEAHVTDIPARIRTPNFSLDPQLMPGGVMMPGIVLGVDLSARLRAGVGSTVVATVPKKHNRGIPRMREFVVTGLFESGIYEYDASFALASIEASRDALALEEDATGLLVRVDDMDRAPQIGQEITRTVQSAALWSNDWVRQNRQLFLWMRLEKLVGYLIFAIILVVAAFLIASTLIMIVLEKTREVGILMSLGAARRGVRWIFVLEGLAIGGLGTFAGCAMGWLGCELLDLYPLRLPGDIYFIDTLPVEIWWGDLVTMGILAIVICLASALYPSWQASRLAPVEAIRYE